MNKNSALIFITNPCLYTVCIFITYLAMKILGKKNKNHVFCYYNYNIMSLYCLNYKSCSKLFKLGDKKLPNQLFGNLF